MQPNYVFIVGLPRTGSKLMVNVLENYQDGKVQISLENFFLGRPFRPGVRQKLSKFGDLSDDANVRRLVNAMYNNEFFGKYWRGLANGGLGVDQQAMLDEILASDRSHRAIYAIMLQIHTDVTEKAILGDKSGPHLYHVPTLLEWFPNAKIVHTFRDPRAVLVSRIIHDRKMREKRRRSKLRSTLDRFLEPFRAVTTTLYVTIAWLRAARLHCRYQQLYPNNYYLSRFEDLVGESELSVRKLCDFLELEFDNAMLKPPQIGSSFRPDQGTGFDRQTLDRWQSHIKPWMNAWLLLWGKKYLRELNYIE